MISTQILPEELFLALKTKKVALLDVREKEELTFSKLPDAIHIPLMSLAENFSEWAKAAEQADISVVFCRGGVRSQMAIDFLEQNGVTGCQNLVGGINAYAQETDSGLEVY